MYQSDSHDVVLQGCVSRDDAIRRSGNQETGQSEDMTRVVDYADLLWLCLSGWCCGCEAKRLTEWTRMENCECRV